MYNCNLNITIYSKCVELENELRRIKELERFTHQFKTSEILTDEIIQNSDILIFESSFNRQEIELIKQHKKESLFFILCILPEDMPLLNAKDYEGINEIWIKPFYMTAIFYYFGKVQQQIKQNMDYQLVQNYLDTLMDTIPDLVWIKDLIGAHLKVNNSFCNTVGKTKNQIQGRGHYYIWDLEMQEYQNGEYVCLETDEYVINAKKTCLFDEKVKCKDEMRQFKTYKAPVFDNDGNVMGTIGVAHDVTDLWNIHAELEVVLGNMPIAILLHDKKGNIQSVNNSFRKLFHVEKDTIVGCNYDNWKTANLIEFKRNMVENVYEAKISIDKEIKILEIRKEAILDIFKKISGYLYMYNDITRKHNQQQKIIYKANTDYLTGLYNRRYLYEYLNNYRNSNQVCLFYIDLDNFKIINDTFGHKEGDHALIAISKILKEVFSDNAVFRIGGDEFIVTLLGVSKVNEIINYANTLLEKIKMQIRSIKKYEVITVSVGIVIDDDPDIDLEELIKRSDFALYEAKIRGKNQYFIWNKDKE